MPECHVAPETTDDAAATLRVAHRMKHKMESDFLEVLHSLLNLHLCATRPERLIVSLSYSPTRTYRGDTSARKDTVGHCQALRLATAAAAGASEALVANPGLLVAIMADSLRRARECGGVTVVRVVPTQAGYSSVLRTQFILDKNVGGKLSQIMGLFLGGRSSGLSSRVPARGPAACRGRAAERKNSDGQGAYLVIKQAALHAFKGDLRSAGQF